MAIRSFALLAAMLAPASSVQSAPYASPGAEGARAVLKAPLPPDAPPGCLAERGEGETVRAGLFSPGGAACPVARVGEEIITLEELAEALASSHGDPRAPGSAAKGLGASLEGALTRLVDLRLIVQEAEEMGMLDIPDVRAAIEEFEAQTLRAQLERETVRDVRPDPAEVERLRRGAVRELRVRSLLFAKREDANAFRRRAIVRGAFERLAAKAIAGKKAEGNGRPEWVSAASMAAPIRAALDEAGRGALTPPVRIDRGWVVARLEGVRYPNVPGAREASRRQSLELRRYAGVERAYAALERKHATVDRALLARLDLEAKEPGFAALSGDRRVLARIAGGDPITVADLAAAVARKFFHGMDRPIEEHRVNAAKRDVFQALLRSRIAAREIAARKLADTEIHGKEMDEYRRALAFGTFVEKVVVPDVRVQEEEAQRWFDEHRAEYTAPRMYRLDGLGFGSQAQAQAAVERLRAGTDLGWLRANAEGRVDEDELRLSLDPARTVSESTFGPALAKALAGARRGDLRLYADGTHHYVISIVDEIPPAVQPYAEARESVAKRIFAERVARAVREYADALRKAHRVDVFIVGIESRPERRSEARP
jgi:hypothetical protein